MKSWKMNFILCQAKIKYPTKYKPLAYTGTETERISNNFCKQCVRWYAMNGSKERWWYEYGNGVGGLFMVVTQTFCYKFFLFFRKCKIKNFFQPQTEYQSTPTRQRVWPKQFDICNFC